MQSLSILQGELLKGVGASDRIYKLINSKPKIPIRGGLILPKVNGNAPG